MPEKVTMKRLRSLSAPVKNSKKKKAPPSESPSKSAKGVQNETFLETLDRLGEADVNRAFALPRWAKSLLKTVKAKDELVTKKEEFTGEDKEIIKRIFGVIQKFLEISEGSPVFGLRPEQYTGAWNTAKKQHAENKSGNPLIPTFLLNVLYATPKDPTNRILTCAAVFLLELSCQMDDFCQHVRRTCIKKYGSCLITNNKPELKWLSGKFIVEKCDEIDSIRGWAGGKLTRTEVTLSIGGESGSGKTRAALQCVRFYRKSKTPQERRTLSADHFLIVYLKVNGESNKHWNNAVAEKHEDAMKTMERLWVEGWRGSYDTYKTAEFLEICMRKVTESEKHALRSLRAALCHHWICRRIAEGTQFKSSFESKNPFKVAFIVLDEVAACPWLYKAVNGVSTDGEYVPAYFSGTTGFARKYRFICVSTASDSIFRDMRSTPGAFEPVTMKPSPMLYEGLMTKTFGKSPLSVFAALPKNDCFAKLVLNRRCAVMAVEVMEALTFNVKPVLSAADDMNNSHLNWTEHDLFSLTDAEGAYALAGFLVCLVAAKYKYMNAAQNLDHDEAKAIVAKGIRAVLCCKEKRLGDVFSGFPVNPLKLGLFHTTFLPLEDGRQEVTISFSAAQQVMAATAYGSGALFTTNITGGAFEVFSASIFSLYLSGYSTDCFGKTIKVATRASLSAFIHSVSATKVGDKYENILKHSSVSGILFASHSIATGECEPLDSYLNVLAEFLGGEDNGQAFVLVNSRSSPYADLIAKSGDILFLIHCEECADTTTSDLATMGFSSSDNSAVDTFVESLDMKGSNLEEQLGDFMVKGTQRVTGNRTTMDSLRLLRGKLLTRLLMKALACNVAVPVLMCREPKDDPKKREWRETVQNCRVQSFGWSDPAALLFVGGSIERSTIISV
ncbi:hypothetical protein, conserved [Angomonas deanei]|uniref:Uncharacterized protein n=1 Tax=Angomonas deanei TaxID=59799 RepID=A0A7G2CI07_9TRYP|nr:hypothetical protein, conserved [Angomonas deanei]